MTSSINGLYLLSFTTEQIPLTHFHVSGMVVPVNGHFDSMKEDGILTLPLSLALLAVESY